MRDIEFPTHKRASCSNKSASIFSFFNVEYHGDQLPLFFQENLRNLTKQLKNLFNTDLHNFFWLKLNFTLCVTNLLNFFIWFITSWNFPRIFIEVLTIYWHIFILISRSFSMILIILTWKYLRKTWLFFIYQLIKLIIIYILYIRYFSSKVHEYQRLSECFNLSFWTDFGFVVASGFERLCVSK